MYSIPRLRLTFVLLAIGLAAIHVSAEAQIPTPEQIQAAQQNPALAEQVRQRIAASGLSPDQIRERLRSAGYDPSLLDEYLPGRRPAAGQEQLTPQMLQALSILGTGLVAPQGLEDVPLMIGLDTLPSDTTDSLVLRPDSLPIFGLDVFRRTTSQFQPMLSGPVPANYRLGPGDVLVVVLTGDVEFVHTLEVTREGFVVVPQVGQIYVNNLTMSQLHNVLRRRLGESYSGIFDGTTRFDVSVARLRTNQIYVIGEVAQPGAYQLSSVATVLNALYAAGGPTENGNFRRVEVRRGDALVLVFDLYDYLIRGQTGADMILSQGDVVRVPVRETRAAVEGAVVRPAYYDLKPSETLSDLIASAGGFEADAALERITISRIVPPDERRIGGPGRTVIDIQINGAATADPDILPGDRVRVHALTEDRKGFVTLEGNVYYPGEYGWAPGMRLSDLVGTAGGFRPATYAGTAHIERLNPGDSTRFLIEVPLPQETGTPYPQDLLLDQFDVVTIYGQQQLRDDRIVSIDGWVREPGLYPFRSGMSMRDLVLQAGGLRDGALLEFAEVARLPGDRSNGRMADVERVPLDSTFIFAAEGDNYALLPGPSTGDSRSERYGLHPFDHVLVLRQPEFELQRTVTLSGEVNLPGTYALRRKDERLSDLVTRAGGLSSSAYGAGARMVRSTGEFGSVDIDLAGALESPGGTSDIALLPGDSIIIPEYNPVVRVEGAVVSPTSVRYRSGADLRYYINAAGGYTSTADEARVSVKYANGSIRTRRDRLFFLDSNPAPAPGSSVRVPYEDPDKQIDYTQFISNVAQIVASLGTLIVVLTR